MATVVSTQARAAQAIYPNHRVKESVTPHLGREGAGRKAERLDLAPRHASSLNTALFYFQATTNQTWFCSSEPEQNQSRMPLLGADALCVFITDGFGYQVVSLEYGDFFLSKN